MQVTEPEETRSQDSPVLEGPWHSGSGAQGSVDTGPDSETGEFHEEATESSAPLRMSDYMNDEDAAFAPTADELSHAASDSASQAPSEPVPDTAPAPAPEPAAPQAAAKAAPASVMDDSPFATETMAELYLQQGLRGEALTIYRQLALKRDDPTIHARIAELESDGSPHTSGETVRAFFARIGQQRPNKRVELAAEHAEQASSSGSSANASPLANLFRSAEPDADDVAAAQRLSGAFGTPQLGNSQS